MQRLYVLVLFLEITLSVMSDFLEQIGHNSFWPFENLRKKSPIELDSLFTGNAGNKLFALINCFIPSTEISFFSKSGILYLFAKFL